MMEARKAIQGTKTLNDVAIQKQQKQNFRSGVSEDAISGEAKEIQETTNALMDEIKIMAKSYLMAYFQFSNCRNRKGTFRSC